MDGLCKVLNGIDTLSSHASILNQGKLGLITNTTGLTRNFESTIDVLHEKFQLTTLFSPEHGVRGNVVAGGVVGDYVDEKTGLPVVSLYGDKRKPNQDALKDVDILVYDIQDVGARFYTYIYTLAYCMEAVAALGKKIVVFDRLNPLGGETVEGIVLEKECASFIGLYPIPARYGLTIGEFATYLNETFSIGADLEVVKIENWKRDMIFPETDLCFVSPSPNIPTFETALLFQGTGIFEGTNASEGRGTTRPFATIGAPYVNGERLAYDMNCKNLAGVKFSTIYFEPTYSKNEKKLCSGVLIHVTDPRAIRAYEVGIHLLYEVMKYDGFEWLKPYREGGRQFIDLVSGTTDIRTGKLNAASVIQRAQEESAKFKRETEKFHLYK